MVAETFIPRSSSHIAGISYDPEVENMDVEFSDGSTYTYFSVPVSVYRAWCSEGGSGQFFQRQVKNRYTYEQQ